jgi:CheY-like chemotaxis protein
VDAIKAIEENPDQRDIFVTDQTMPTIKGTDLVNITKSPITEIFRINFSGYSTDMDEREAENSEADAVITKPSDLNYFHALAQAHIKVGVGSARTGSSSSARPIVLKASPRSGQ